MTRASWALVVAFALALVPIGGCTPAPAPTPDAGGDGSPTCGSSPECDDGVYCNGRETCMPGAAGADVRGCVLGAAPCALGIRCDEASDACETTCAGEPDVDGDGVDSVACGGLDCDDDDALRHPGSDEVCGADDRDEDCDPATFGDRDLDGDGEVAATCCNGTTCGTDCDDTRRGTNSSVPEVCDGLDNDCDGAVDEGLLEALYLDADFDGVGDGAREVVGCLGTPGVSAASGDCDDTLASVRPTAPEICDGLDNDCDGDVDDDTVAVPWYVDADADGWGTVSATQPSVDSCVRPAGRAIRVGDCDDGDGAVSPTAPELCNALDDDCDGQADYLVGGRDTEDDDRDGVPDAACAASTIDCDDEDPLVAVASSTEICDDRDNDCDGRVDEDAAPVAWYVDMDGDGFGDPAGASVSSCDIQPGRALEATDCDDRDAGTYPGAVDSCAGRLGVDDDCDGLVDEGGTALTVYVDADGDGYGVGEPIRSCLADARSATRAGDCDDAEPRVSPAALDDCAGLPGVDDNCDGRTDETLTPRTFYDDPDGDGFGSGSGMSGCAQPAGTATANGDCDEASILRNPGVPDDCATAQGLDDDCDGSIDEARVLLDFYRDRDGDGFGTDPPVSACTPPAGTTSTGGDCDDDDASRSPSAPDDCSRPMSVDDDCDGSIDEDAMFLTVYRDVDGDGYGSGESLVSCGRPAGYVTAAGDCDESSPAIHPARLDDYTTALGVDDDCDGAIDDAVVLRAWYPDADRDGAGVGTPVMACAAPSNHAALGDDCDDANINRHPRRADDCSTTAGIDDDCDMLIDEDATPTTYYRDADGDTFGDPGVTQSRCTPLGGYVTNSTDCDDSRSSVRPGGTEVCANGLDDDCNTLRDCADLTCVAGCGLLEVLSGGGQTGAIHAPLAAPLRVRVTDGMGTVLAGRAVTLSTSGVTAASFALVTDALGEVSFTGMRAGYSLAPETVTISAFGAPDITTTFTAVPPAPGTILSIFNGPRYTAQRGIPGPTYNAGTDGAGGMGGLAGALDGTIYVAMYARIFRIAPSGVVSVVLGSGAFPTATLPDGIDALSAALGATSNTALALDEPRNRLFFSRNCAVYVWDIASNQVHPYANRAETCGFAGDTGLALDAQLYSVESLAVTRSGVVFLSIAGSSAGPRRVRYIDTSGRIDTAIATYGGTPALHLGGWMGPVSAIPGSDEVLLSTPDCELGTSGGRACILRLDAAGNLTHIAGGTGSSSLDGIPATTARIGGFPGPAVMLSTGEIIVNESGDHRLRRIDTMGNITTIAGTMGMAGDTGDGGASTAARIQSIYWITAWRGSHVAFWQTNVRAIRGIW